MRCECAELSRTSTPPDPVLFIRHWRTYCGEIKRCFSVMARVDHGRWGVWRDTQNLKGRGLLVISIKASPQKHEGLSPVELRQSDSVLDISWCSGKTLGLSRRVIVTIFSLTIKNVKHWNNSVHTAYTCLRRVLYYSMRIPFWVFMVDDNKRNLIKANYLPKLGLDLTEQL